MAGRVKPKAKMRAVGTRIILADSEGAMSALYRPSDKLRANEQAVEQWLSTDVAETYDRMRADPDRGVLLDAAFQRLRRARGLQCE